MGDNRLSIKDYFVEQDRVRVNQRFHLSVSFLAFFKIIFNQESLGECGTSLGQRARVRPVSFRALQLRDRMSTFQFTAHVCNK